MSRVRACLRPHDWYLGTDIGVFHSTNAGTGWTNYSQGMPNTAIYDLRLRAGGTLLRAATHGRGLWEIRTDLAIQPTVDLFVRDHVMDTGRAPSGAPAKAAWEDLTRHIGLNTPCFWWDAPTSRPTRRRTGSSPRQTSTTSTSRRSSS